MSKIGNYFIEYLDTHPEIDIEDTSNEKQVHSFSEDTRDSQRHPTDYRFDSSNSSLILVNSGLT